MTPAILAIMLIFGLPILVVGGFFVIWSLKIITRGGPRHEAERLSEETRLIQEIHRGLSKMEERIEALETILLDPERKDKPSHE